MQALPAGAYQRQPWKNGRGATREIAKDLESPYRWRISSADLTEAGPFSFFYGYDRTLIVLDGGPIVLTHNEQPPIRLQLHTVYRFSGDWATSMTLQSPGHDLNIFARRDSCRAGVAILDCSRGPENIVTSQNEQFLYCLQGRAQCADRSSGESIVVEGGDTMKICKTAPNSPATVVVTGGPDCRLVKIEFVL